MYKNICFRHSEKCVNELTNLTDKPEYLVFSTKYNLLVSKVKKLD